MTEATQLAIHPQQRPRIYWVFRDTFVLIVRSLKHIKQDPDQLVSVTIQPVLLVVLFRYLFGGAISTGSHESYINFLMAGVFIETAALTAVTTSTSVTADVLTGVMDRFRSLPMLRLAILTGHVVADLCRSLIGMVVMVLVGLVVGFRPSADAKAWVTAIGLTLLVTFALSWVSALLGLLGNSVEAVQQFGIILIVPIFASSAFVPTQTMPSWLRVFADNQPMTQAIDAVRALLLGQPVGDHVRLTLIWFIGIVLVVFPIADWLFKRRTSS